MKSATQVWRRQKTNYQNLGKTGVVVSKTRIIEAPMGFSGQYWVVMVELGKNKRAVGQWASEAEPKIGMNVVGVLRKIGETEKAGVIEYG